MYTPITNTVSTFIDSQLPQFIRENDPNLVAFIKAYYEWMEQSVDSDIIRQSKALLSYDDIDSTTDQFIQYYINDFLPYFPNEVALDERKLIKLARNFYQKKGSVESIQFLFRVLYNKEADIYFPKNNILRASDGKWMLPKALDILVTAANRNFDFNLLVGRLGLGSLSNASCVIESATLTVDQGLGIELLQVYVSNINQEFQPLENLNVVYGYDANNNPLVFSSKIISSISNIVINPHYLGTFYKGFIEDNNGNIVYEGDPVTIIDSLEPNDPLAQKAVAFVNSVTQGSITSANVLFGGYGYRPFPNTVTTVINDPTDTTGTGANVIVQALDTSNSIYVNVNIDSVFFEQNVYVNATNYLFSNFAFANSTTALNLALTFANTQFAPLVSMNVINGGGNYSAVPSLNLVDTYFTDLVDSDPNSPPFVQETIQTMDDLGLFCAVNIGSGGMGYSNVTDQIVVPSAIGYNAVFTFTTAPTTNTISSVTVTNRGFGYIELPIQLAVVNSTNVMNASAGVGANLIGYGFGQGANIDLSVNQIGEIIDFRLTNRGFDYISTPNVSLRVADLVINSIPPGDAFITDSQVYQGTNIGTATWLANVDSYNVTSSVLRVYNYKGSLKPYANIVDPSFNATINTAVTDNIRFYGDGLAKANAIFLNGLIAYPGYYLATDGFLSSDQYLQDANTYHPYSYVIVVEKALIDYKKTLMQIVHPVGMSMLGSYSIAGQGDLYDTPVGNVNIIPVVAGTVNISSSDNGVMSGIGTNFGQYGNAGDMIVFNTSDTSRLLQAKIITNVYNTTFIKLESNSRFFLYEANVIYGSNVITLDGAYGNIGLGDTLLINVNNMVYTCNANAVFQNSIYTNAFFLANQSNCVVRVQPIINLASYIIIEQAT